MLCERRWEGAGIRPHHGRLHIITMSHVSDTGQREIVKFMMIDCSSFGLLLVVLNTRYR